MKHFHVEDWAAFIGTICGSALIGVGATVARTEHATRVIDIGQNVIVCAFVAWCVFKFVRHIVPRMDWF